MDFIDSLDSRKKDENGFFTDTDSGMKVKYYGERESDGEGILIDSDGKEDEDNILRLDSLVCSELKNFDGLHGLTHGSAYYVKIDEYDNSIFHLFYCYVPSN